MTVAFLPYPSPALDLEADCGVAVVAYREMGPGYAGSFLVVDAQGHPEWVPMARVQLVDQRVLAAVPDVAKLLAANAVAAA